MNIKLAVFDFDGTLMDTKETIVVAKQETMKELGLPVADVKSFVGTIGLSAKLGFQKIYPDLSDEMLDLCVKTYREKFNSLKETIPPVLFPNVKETLKTLKMNDIVCTIATSRNRKSLLEFLALMKLSEFFTYILAGEDTPLLKPHPDAVLKTLADLSFKAENTIVIGDMPYDILMGKNAGVHTCGVTYGCSEKADLLEAGAEYIIEDFAELPGLIK